MEFWLLLAYARGANRKPLQGFTPDLAAAFLLLDPVLAVCWALLGHLVLSPTREVKCRRSSVSSGAGDGVLRIASAPHQPVP